MANERKGAKAKQVKTKVSDSTVTIPVSTAATSHKFEQKGFESTPNEAEFLKEKTPGKGKNSVSSLSNVDDPDGPDFPLHKQLLILLLLFLSSTLPYLPTLSSQCCYYDDGEALTKNADLSNIDLSSLSHLLAHDFWGTPLSDPETHCSFRPLTVLSYVLNHHFFPAALEPLPHFSWHLINILLHGACTLLIFIFSQRLHSLASTVTSSRSPYLPTYIASLSSALLFALHPVHVDAVAQLVGRAELIACVLSIGSSILYVDASLLRYPASSSSSSSKQTFCKSCILVTLSIVLTFLALLSKEQGIMPLAAVLLVDLISTSLVILHRKPFTFKALLTLHPRQISVSTALLIMVVWRLNLCGDHNPAFCRHLNPLIYIISPFYRSLNILWIWVLNVRMLVWPGASLCHDWNGESITLITTVTDARVLMMLVVVAISVLGLVKGVKNKSYVRLLSHKITHQQFIYLTSALFTMITFLPSSHLFLKLGFVLAERVLYLPSIGICILLGSMFSRFLFIENKSVRSKRLTIMLSSSVVLLLVSRTYSRALDFETYDTLLRSGLRTNPQNERLWAELGRLSLQDISTGEEGLVRLDKAIEINPSYLEAMMNKGILLFGMVRYAEALAMLEEIFHLTDNAAAIEMEYGRNFEAVIINYKTAAHTIRGNIGFKGGDMVEALNEWRIVHDLTPSAFEGFHVDFSTLSNDNEVVEVNVHPLDDVDLIVARLCRKADLNFNQCNNLRRWFNGVRSATKGSHSDDDTATPKIMTPTSNQTFGYRESIIVTLQGPTDARVCLRSSIAPSNVLECGVIPFELSISSNVVGLQLLYLTTESDENLLAVEDYINDAVFLTVRAPKVEIVEVIDFVGAGTSDNSVLHINVVFRLFDFNVGEDGDVCMIVMIRFGAVSYCVDSLSLGDGQDQRIELKIEDKQIMRSYLAREMHLIAALRENKTMLVKGHSGFPQSGRLLLDRRGNEPAMYEQESLSECIDSLALSQQDEWGLYSKNGEDGIISKILMCVTPSSSTPLYVELGVADGSECNTRLLKEVKGWAGIVMDGAEQNDPHNFDIKREFITADNVRDLFLKYEVPHDFELLSVGIDSNDFWVWRSILEGGYKPRLVVVAVNSNLGDEDSVTAKLEVNEKWDGSDWYGASVLAMVRLGRVFGYTLVYCESHGVNCFFVRNVGSDNVESTAEVTKRLFKGPNYHGLGKGAKHVEEKNWITVNEVG